MARLAHKMVAEIAKGIAEEVYEACARDNQFYKVWPNRKRFVEQKYGLFLKPARATLAKMLTMDYPEQTKEEIVEALALDKTLPKGNDMRITPQPLH